MQSSLPSDNRDLVPLLPISNRQVKQIFADDSLDFSCESRSSLGFFYYPSFLFDMNYSYSTLKLIKYHLLAGGLIAFPTEYIYGIGCNPKNYKAMRKLLLVKRRVSTKGFIMISNKLANINQMVNINKNNILNHIIEYKASKNNTQAVSFVVPKRYNTLSILTGYRTTVAFRLIDNMNTIAQISSLLPNRLPIIASSANISGRIAFKDYKNSYNILGSNQQVLVLKGHGKFLKQVSRIISLPDNTIIRN